MDEKQKNHAPKRQEKSGASRVKKFGMHKGVTIGGAVVLCLLAAYLIICGVAASHSGTVLPGTTVAGVPVGGMTLQEVEQALQNAQEQWQAQDDAYLIFQVRDEVVPTKETQDAAPAVNPEGEAQPEEGAQPEGEGDAQGDSQGNDRDAVAEGGHIVRVPANYMELDWEASAQLVWEERRNDQGFLAAGTSYLGSLISGKSVSPVYVAGGQLDLLLNEELDNQVGRMMEDSTAMIVGENLELTKGVPGHEVDKEALKAQLFALLAAGETVDKSETAPQFSVPLVETLPQKLDMQAVYDELYVEPQDASVSEEGGFQVEIIGISFDVEEAQRAFDALDWGELCELPLILTEPEVKLTDLEEYLYQDLLGACQTNIGGSANRLSNVKLAASFCNEKVLAPGEEFSYNGIVGRRTSARGFLPAPAYVAGETVDEIGGGICQVSSTIYLASLRANLQIVERYNHGYTVGYVPNGLDATVYYGSLDFRFKNNTAYPIKIVATVSGRTLSVSIYGTNPDKISVEMKTVQSNSTGYNTVYKVDNSVAVGSSKTSVTPYSGCTVKSYRHVYKNGELISSDLEATSTYKSRDKVVLVNSADAYKYGIEGATPPAEPTPIEPTPAPPTPTEPTPTPSTPTEPTPAPSTPTEPTPTEPTPAEPAPVEPPPTEPAPTDTSATAPEGEE